MNVHKVLVPIDYSDYSDRALQWGAGLAEKFGAQLLLLHVIPRASQDVPGLEATAPPQLALDSPSVYYPPSPPPEGMMTIDPIDIAQNELKDFAVARLNTRASVIPRIGVGRPAEEIVRVARDERVDLIVMGTHGRSGLRHLLAGSVAEAVMRTAPCPVFTVKRAAQPAP
jgi:universal stress protein A